MKQLTVLQYKDYKVLKNNEISQETTQVSESKGTTYMNQTPQIQASNSHKIPVK